MSGSSKTPPSMSWPPSFEPPPPKGPPPQIPLPKTPAQDKQRNVPVSPLSGPPSNEYFSKFNFSQSTPSRAPPNKSTVRAPLLQRLSEADSITENGGDDDEELDPVPQAPFRSHTQGSSPVSPFSIREPEENALPAPSAFDLDKASGGGRKGSESSGGTLASAKHSHRLSRGRSLGYPDDDEPKPFIPRGDKHRRILGIEENGKKTSSKRGSAPKTDESTGSRRKRDISDPGERSSSPMPAADVVPFLYQDMEDVRRQPGGEAPVHTHPVSSVSSQVPAPQLNIQSHSSIWNRHASSPTIRPVDKMYTSPLNKASTNISSNKDSGGRERKDKQKGLLSRWRAKKKEDSDTPQGPSPHPLSTLGILDGSTSFSDLHLPNPGSTTMKHQHSFSSLSSGGGTPNQANSTFSFNTYGQMHTPQPTGARPTRAEETSRLSHQNHHHHSLFHRHHSPSQSHTTPGKVLIDDEEIILDTDLGKLQGIVSNRVPQSLLDGRSSIGEVNPVAPWESSSSPRVSAVTPGNGSDATWTAPESWGVRPHNSEDLVEFPPEEPHPASKQTHPIRVFRTDSTFATIPCAANVSVNELITLLAKKFFVPAGERWVLVYYYYNLARVLQPSEKPLVIQQKSLERLGYIEEADGGGEMGRDDWSGFWRFVFMRADGLANVAEEVHLDHFQNVNFDSKNLQTIPLALYRHASEVLTLNVSRNLSLSIPTDFIDSCVNLQEIKFTHNEARRTPKSISSAPALTHLDLSHNRLEEIEHIDWSSLRQLLSLKVTNNKLSSLPSQLIQLADLRLLDLGSNHFKEFPAGICELVNLSDLDLSFNLIEEIPESIGNLTNLSRLIITNNKLKTFPSTVGEMENLRELDCRFNSIHSIDVLATIPNLESLYCGHNAISAVDPSTRFPKLRHFHMNKNPTTKLLLPVAPDPSRTIMTYLNIAGAKLSTIDEAVFDALQNLERLVLDDNAFSTLPFLGKIKKLQYLHCANNSLQTLPNTIGSMTALKSIDVHNNNLKLLPPEIWQIVTLEGLNATSNLLSAFPKPPSVHSSISSSASGLGEELNTSPSKETVPASRKNSSVSVGRMAKILSQETVSSMRKDSSASTMTSRTANTIAQSLRVLMLGDNRLGDDVFEQISFLTELRVLNLSYNEIYEIPTGALSRLTQLAELYISGNELSSLPADDLERMGTLRILHLNCNKLQTLPAELGKIRRLHVLDVGSNSLKYNINNWPYDWNWNWNLDLKYLNLSGNKRLEIKQQATNRPGERDLSDFHALTKLRLLGLMDVTLMGTTVPEQTENRRVRTIGSEAAGMAYGVADTLGKHDHLSVSDIAITNFRGSGKEVIYQVYDGMPKPGGGNRIAKYLQEHFRGVFLEELHKLKAGESVSNAFRRTFLTINKNVADLVTHNLPSHNGLQGGQGSNKRHQGSIMLDAEDLNRYGSSALVAYINGKTLTVANVGDCIAVLARTTGEVKVVSKKHQPGEASELDRIRGVGGSLTRNGKISCGHVSLDTSRAIGFTKYSPPIIAAPYIEEVTLSDQDEVLILANNELWKSISYQTAVDVVRTERDDALRAAHKLRDFAMAYGASGRICVMVIRVGDLFHKKVKQPWSRNASASYSAANGYLPGDEEGFFAFAQKKRKGRDELPEDSTLARLEREVPPPMGDVAMVFTDIKNSTMLWESYPIAMRSAIKTHNTIMRRQMRIIGGYEVKTEGDAFIVSFPTITLALQWCFAVQTNLLTADWPAEILESEHCKEIYHPERGDLLHRGLSVRMGCHWGNPVCEIDPITKRMDYFGPMMNRTSRISAVADGGQITISADVENELRNLEQLADSVPDTDPEDDDFPNPMLNIKRDMEALKRTGFAISPVGERKLKGLENSEFIYLIYPNQLIGRLHMDRLKLNTSQPMQHHVEGSQAPIVPGPERIIISDDVRIIPLSDVRLLHMLTYRIEKLCSTSMVNEDEDVLQQRRAHNLREEDSDEVIIQAVESLVTRIENAITRLSLRHCAFEASTQDIVLDDEDIIKAIQMYVRHLQEQKEQSSVRRLRRYSTYQGARYSMPATKSLGISFI